MTSLSTVMDSNISDLVGHSCFNVNYIIQHISWHGDSQRHYAEGWCCAGVLQKRQKKLEPYWNRMLSYSKTLRVLKSYRNSNLKISLKYCQHIASFHWKTARNYFISWINTCRTKNTIPRSLIVRKNLIYTEVILKWTLKYLKIISAWIKICFKKVSIQIASYCCI